MTDFRKLAAIDIAFLGHRFIFAEYAFGVVFAVGLGLFVLHRSHSFWQVVQGAYLMCLGIDYVPMLIYTIKIGGRQRAQAELGDELAEKRKAMSKYRRLSLLLLVPLLIPIVAAAHGRISSREDESGSK